MGQCIVRTCSFAGDNSDDCTAGKNQVLAGYKAITKDSDDEAVGGTMPNNGTWSKRIGVNEKVTIPAGYHNGQGYVDQAITNRGTWGANIGINGNITIPEGYHNGQGRITQSIPTMAGQTITPSTTQQTISSSGKYMTGNVIVPGFTMPPANVIKKGYTLNIYNQQVTGTFEGYVLTANDMYKNGYNPAGFTTQSDYVTLYLDRIEIADTENGKWLGSNNSFNFTGHANIKVDCELCCGSTGAREITFFKDITSGWNSFGVYTVPGSSCTGRIIITIPLPANMGSRLVALQIGASITGEIYRIWLE